MEKTLTISDIAEKLRLSVSTIYKYTESQKIPSIKVGNRIRIMEGELDKFILSCQTIAPKKKKETKK